MSGEVREALERLYSAAHGWAFDNDEGEAKAVFDERYGELCELVLRSATEDEVERIWYALGLALVREGFAPPAYIDDELRERLKRVAAAVVEAQNDNGPAEARPLRQRA